MRYICGNCAKEYPDFRGIWDCWCDHLAEGVVMVDWVEVPTSWVTEGKQLKMEVEK